MKEEKGHKFRKKLTRLLLSVFILFLFIAFNFQDTGVGSWFPQYIYNTNEQHINDLAFSDSLTGFITTWKSYSNQGRILKTMNGGDNWFSNYMSDTAFMFKIQPLNKDTIIVCEGNSVLKTTNKGINWTRIFFPGYPYNEMNAYDISALNFDTIWISCGTGFNQPQMYLTTNGGINWTLKFQLSSGVEFSRVYFYNKRIGFCCTGSNTYKTTNGGDNWFQLTKEIFKKMIFTDSLTGWKCETFNYSMKKTTDGGYNWVTQVLPSGGQISDARMYDFDVINKDTLWGCGGRIFHSPPPNRIKGIIYKTTNGGLNWGYQLPDTNVVKYSFYDHIKFFGKNYGWVYESDSGSGIRMGGVHTTTGGLDSTIYVGINNNITNISLDYILFQNFPNPFNPRTVIGYSLLKNGNIQIKVYDILGKEITTLVNENKKSGNYEVKFDGSNYASGIYFYTLFVENLKIDTKKLLLIK